MIAGFPNSPDLWVHCSYAHAPCMAACLLALMYAEPALLLWQVAASLSCLDAYVSIVSTSMTHCGLAVLACLATAGSPGGTAAMSRTPPPQQSLGVLRGAHGRGQHAVNHDDWHCHCRGLGWQVLLCMGCSRCGKKITAAAAAVMMLVACSGWH